MITTISEEEITAKKQHQCFWCFRAISPGTVYRKTVQVDSGEIETLKTHVECDQEVRRLEDNGIIYDDGNGWPHGLLCNGYVDEQSQEWKDFYDSQELFNPIIRIR